MAYIAAVYVPIWNNLDRENTKIANVKLNTNIRETVGGIRSMSEKKLSKEELREGTSWRAQVFRAKDEHLKFDMNKLVDFMMMAKVEHPEIEVKLHEIHNGLQKVTVEEDNEEVGEKTIENLEVFAKMLKDAGFDG